MRFPTPTLSIWLRAGLLLLVLGLALPAVARDVHVYEVRHRLAQELVAPVETALGAEGRVVADGRTNTLVLSGDPAAVENALGILAALDVRPRTVVLRYGSEDAASLTSRDLRIDWRIEAGGFRVGTVVGGKEPSGSRVGVRLAASRLEREGRQTAVLRVLEGRSGRIASGVQMPFTKRRVVFGARGRVVQESTQLLSAEAGFDVRPRVLGDGRIELALRPLHQRLGTDGRIQTAGAETHVVVTPGETCVIGGLTRSEQGERRDLAGAGTTRVSEQRLLLIRADIEGPREVPASPSR